MTNNLNELTFDDLLKEIRLLCGLEIHKKKWFNRKELKAIASKITPAARLISDDQTKVSYCSNQNIFPKYITGWVSQKTDNCHPSKENLMNIYQLIRSQKKAVKESSATIVPKTIVGNKKLESILNALKTCNLITQTDKCVIEADNSIVIKFK